MKIAKVVTSFILHLGVFCVIFAVLYLLVRFTSLTPQSLYLIPPLFVLYLGIFLIFTFIKKRKNKTNGDR